MIEDNIIASIIIAFKSKLFNLGFFSVVNNDSTSSVSLLVMSLCGLIIWEGMLHNYSYLHVTFPYDRRFKRWFDPVMKHELHMVIKIQVFPHHADEETGFRSGHLCATHIFNRRLSTFMHRWTGAHLKLDAVWHRSVQYHKHMIYIETYIS